MLSPERDASMLLNLGPDSVTCAPDWTTRLHLSNTVSLNVALQLAPKHTTTLHHAAYSKDVLKYRTAAEC